MQIDRQFTRDFDYGFFNASVIKITGTYTIIL